MSTGDLWSCRDITVISSSEAILVTGERAVRTVYSQKLPWEETALSLPVAAPVPSGAARVPQLSRVAWISKAKVKAARGRKGSFPCGFGATLACALELVGGHSGEGWAGQERDASSSRCCTVPNAALPASGTKVRGCSTASIPAPAAVPMPVRASRGAKQSFAKVEGFNRRQSRGQPHPSRLAVAAEGI